MSTKKLDQQIMEMAHRIRELRQIVGLSTEQMAKFADISHTEYLACESGTHDLTFAFLYRCAQALGVDVTDLIEGASPRLRSYTVTRSGKGQKIEQAHGMTYYNLAAAFQNRIAEPLYVVTQYSEQALTKPIALTTHEGQECDIVLRGQLKVQIGSHTEILGEGDSVYYDSSTPHGMVALGGQDCLFYAIVLNPQPDESPAQVSTSSTTAPAIQPTPLPQQQQVWQKHICVTEDTHGTLTSISFPNADTFNFAFDIVDRLGTEKPDKLAMLHIGKDLTERRFTFADIKRASAQTANYFRSLGIQRGDRVLLILKRHYQFWFSVLALHKLGAIAIPATNQLKEHDITYRLEKAGISAVICTADDEIPQQMERAAAAYPSLCKILVGASRAGWHNFDAEYPLFSGRFPRPADAPCGEDPMLMYFTSGTTGNPKVAMHCYKYPLGHFVTARYWHNVNPEGLHLSIADTGWAKAAWGKLYGQWLCEAAVFVYDFDRFDASVILPMFAKYHITTFCAPPTILRMMVKQDLSRYDLSSVQHMSTAGEALNPEVFRQFEAATGLQIMEGFGQSETTVALANLRGTKIRPGSMGKPVALYDIDLVDDAGNSVPCGEVGEIVIRVANGAPCGLFRGYYRDPEKTAECWHDGLYHTGDTAWRDEEGYFWYVGRTDDVIKSSGYRIGPFEIENIIMELPYVLECGVTAVPDALRGQIVKACIVLTADRSPSDALAKEIQNYVKAHTAPYKYPRLVEFRSELPKTASGKIMRNKL